MKEEWKEFASYKFIKYEASNLGRFRRIGKQKISYLKPYRRSCFEREKHKNRAHSVIIKISLNKKQKEYNCNRLLATLFIRELNENDVVININNDRFDLRVKNLFITTRKSLGSITGGKSSKSKRIVYYDNINYRFVYSSARALAKQLQISYQTVLNIANNKIKKPRWKIVWESEEKKGCEEK